MKKITGKALSLVLSLALVVSSFSTISASASTKTMDGIVNDTDNDSVYLVNGGTSDAAMSNSLKSWINPVLETKTRDSVDSVKFDALSHVSGDSLVSLTYTHSGTTNTDHDDAWLKLKSKSVNGTEVVSLLYEGTYTDDDGNDYTVKARKNFTVYVYDKDTPVMGEVKDSTDPATVPTDGSGLDDLETFAQTRNTVKTVGLYLVEPVSSSSATATFAPINVTTDKKGVTGVTSGVLDGVTLKDSGYYLEITDGKSDLHFANSSMTTDQGKSVAAAALYTLNDASNPFQLVSGTSLDDSDNAWDPSSNAYTKDAGTTNVTFTLKRLKADGTVSSSSDDKYTFKTKIEKKINVEQAYKNAGVADDGVYTITKSDSQTRLIGVTDHLSSDGKNSKYLNVSDAILDFPAYTQSVDIGDDQDTTNTKSVVGYVGKLTIGEDAHIGSIDIKDGTVDNSGKVGNISTDDKLWANSTSPVVETDDGAVTVESTGTAGDIDTTSADKDITNEGWVKIYGGTVGAVTSKNTVDIDGQDSDDNIVTGIITANGGTIYSDEAKVSIDGLKAKNDDGTFTLEGDALTVKAIDLDARTTTVQFGDTDNDDEAFTGTVATVKNATNATIKTENEDTSATITGDLNVDELSLDTDTKLTLSGNTQAKTIDGDGTLTIAAGKLYVTDSVSGTKLKLSDSTIAVGTTVFTAKADAVSEDDFTPYGYTLAVTSGSTVDTFKIASLSFAGPQITGTASQLVVGQTGTYTASAYPGGTSLPSGYTVEWSLDGGSTDVFTLASNGTTATVKVNSVDSTFASENKTSLTATLYDADGYEVDDYDPATFDITAVTTPSTTYTSDTTGTVNMTVGGTYQFKITSANGSVPTFVVAGNGGAAVTSTAKSGNDYFYKVTALKAGDYGVYVNGTTRTAVLHITGAAVSIDTAAVTVKAGSTYQFKVTSSVKPVFGLGSGSATLVSSSSNGNNYFYKVKAAGKAGDKVGIYVNGVRMAVVTVG